MKERTRKQRWYKLKVWRWMSPPNWKCNLWKWQRTCFCLDSFHPHKLQNTVPLYSHLTDKFKIYRCQVPCSSCHSYNNINTGIKCSCFSVMSVWLLPSHQPVSIWESPVAARTRGRGQGRLHKQGCKEIKFYFNPQWKTCFYWFYFYYFLLLTVIQGYLFINF